MIVSRVGKGRHNILYVFAIIRYDTSAPLRQEDRLDQTSCTNHIRHLEQVIMKRREERC